MKNIIAEHCSSDLIIQVEELNDKDFIGRVLVGDISNPIGTYSRWSISDFHIRNNEPKTIENKEEFDMTTPIGRLAYAKKHYPKGTKYRGLDLSGNVLSDIYQVYSEPRDNQYFNIDAGPHWLYIDKLNKWAEIIKEKEFNISNNEPKEDKIVTQIVDKFKKRSEIGIKKYNTTLEENNTDDFYEHISEELMDALLYLQKIKEQKDTYFLLLGRYNELKASCERFDVQNAIDELQKLGYIVGLKM